jgi:hypothetical protein
VVLEPGFGKRDYPWMGGAAELFALRLGQPAVDRLHGYVRHVYDRETYQLTVLYQGTGAAVAVHCRYRGHPRWWVMDDDARGFAPRQLRATSQPLEKWLQHERTRTWWTIAERRVPAYIARSLGDR